MEARHVRGDYSSVPYLNSGSALAAGEIITFAARPAIVHPTGIAAGALGNIVVFGGEWELAKSGAGPAVTLGDEVAWITSTNFATDVLTANLHFGFCTEAVASSATVVKAFFNPHGSTT